MFPLVASIITSPGLNTPRSSARLIIDKAGLSLTLPAGLFPSSFANTTFFKLPLFGGRSLCSLTRGVLPTVSSMVWKEKEVEEGEGEAAAAAAAAEEERREVEGVAAVEGKSRDARLKRVGVFGGICEKEMGLPGLFQRDEHTI